MTIDRIKLGSTDLEVPKICLGTMTFGEQNTEAQAHEQLSWAMAHDINFIDTAEMYPIPTKAESFTRTESIIGRWLTHQDRSKLVIATKIAGPGRGMPWVRQGLRQEAGPLTREDFQLACDASLARLQTDVIDLYQIHWPTRNMPLFGSGRFDGSKDYPCASFDEQLEAMDRLKRAGKVRYFGVSNETSWGVSEFIKVAEQYGLPRIASIQNIYNLMAREYELSLTETCHHENVGLLAYSPLAFGLLTGKYRNASKPAGARLSLFGDKWPRYAKPELPIIAQAYEALALKWGMSLTQMSLAFCYHSRSVASTIIGATNVAQLEECLKAYDTRLSAEQLREIDKLQAQFNNPLN
jgi:aryl-alcohol dehydrogenase-like predicted oxidoreductase